MPPATGMWFFSNMEALCVRHAHFSSCFFGSHATCLPKRANRRFLLRTYWTKKKALAANSSRVSRNDRESWKILACASPSQSLAPSCSSNVEREEGMPIPGIITFRRSAVQTHYEYVTDLESLGLEGLSSQMSRSVALSMGFQASSNNNTSSSSAATTPVSVSIDVSKEGKDLRLDGIVRTALAMRCSRCGVPVAERIFADFSLLLTEQPVVEPTKSCIGVVLGDSGPRMPDEGEEGDEQLDIDLDDKLHFPRSEKSIDISKYIRDTVHLDIPLRCLCSIHCRGICIECRVNLNKDECRCKASTKDENVEEKRAVWGPLEQLRQQLNKEQA